MVDRHAKANVKEIKWKAEKEKLSWVWGSARGIVSETLGEGIVSIREYGGKLLETEDTNRKGPELKKKSWLDCIANSSRS